MSDVNIRKMSGVNSEIKLRRMFIKKDGTSEQGRKGRVCPIAQVTKHNFRFISFVFKAASTSTRACNILDMLRMACWLIRTGGQFMNHMAHHLPDILFGFGVTFPTVLGPAMKISTKTHHSSKLEIDIAHP